MCVWCIRTLRVRVLNCGLIFICVSLQEIKDTSGGCGQSFEAVIVSSQFEGKPLLARHRLVNECLAEELAIIHAFSQKTYTPEQWTKLASK